MVSSLEALKATGTTVVSDTGDFASIAKCKPRDATTNPPHILAACRKPVDAELIDVAVAYGKTHAEEIDEQVDAALDRLLVQFSVSTLGIAPRKVSTEIDARFSFDTQASVNKARQIVEIAHSHKYCLNIGMKKSYLHHEVLFRFDFNKDQMAAEKLRESISNFAADADVLKAILRGKIERK